MDPCPPFWRGASQWLVATLVILAALGPTCVRGRPNFVIIMADDLGYGDLGVTGNPDVETPHIDALAYESVWFDSAYANAICAPTRAQLLTGRHFLRTGVWGVHGNRDYLNLDERTFAERLKDGGYRTAMFGKWHNGITDGYNPWDRGFEEACTADLYDYYDNDATCNGEKRFVHGWTTERIFDWSMDFIERKKHESFALYVPLMTPHLGKTFYTEQESWHAPQHLISKYENKGLSHHLSRLYANIDFMDYNVGRLLYKLDETGLAENTVVIFLSDNGPTGDHLISGDEWWRRNPLSLNGVKGQVKDNGIRVPLFIRWRGSFQPHRVFKALVSVEDLYPTMMELSGVWGGDRHIDGRSITELLWNPYEVSSYWSWRTLFHAEGPQQWTRAEGVYWLAPGLGYDKSALHFNGGGDLRLAVRQGPWKYLNTGGYEALYDVWNDPAETSPIMDQAKIDELKSWLVTWWDGMVSDYFSFARPHFYLGWSSVSTIPAMGAAEVSDNLIIKSHHVEGWASAGTYAMYKVIIQRQGCYNAHINYWGGFEGNLAAQIFCNGEAYSSGWLDGGGYFATICAPSTGDSGCLIKFSVESGEGWLGFSSWVLYDA